MNCKKLLAGILSAAMVFTTMAIPAFAEDTDGWGAEKTVKIGTEQYATLADAIKAANKMDGNLITIDCKENADLGDLNQVGVLKSLTINGNGAKVKPSYMSFDMETFDSSQIEGGAVLKTDVTVTVNNLSGIGAWGTRKSQHSVDLIFNNCKDMNYIYLVGGAGVNNITLKGCSFDAANGAFAGESIDSQSKGKIVVENTSFNGIIEPIKLNNKSNGSQEISIIDSVFTNCSVKDGTYVGYQAERAPIYVKTSGEGATSNVIVSGCEFKYDSGNTSANGQIRIGDNEKSTDNVMVTVSNNKSAVKVRVLEPDVEAKEVEVAANETEIIGATSAAVAEVNGTKYTTISVAITAAGDGATVKLLSDVTESVVIAADKNIVLDLNGYTLTNEDKKHTIENYGTLEIVDGSADGTGTVDNVTHGKASLVNNEGGVVTLNGGTFERSAEKGTYEPYVSGGNSYYTLMNKGKMTINTGVTVKNSGGHSSNVVNVGESAENTAQLTVNGGTFSGGINSIKNDDYGVLEIKDGSFINTVQDCILNWYKATISGGEFKGSEGANSVYNGSYNNMIGDLTITGGTFTGTIVAVNYKGQAKANPVTSIVGGTFDTDVTKFCAEGYSPAENDNGTYTVEESKITWTTDTDSGIYTVEGKDFGMMRFMFGAAGVEAGDVTNIGIKYIKLNTAGTIDSNGKKVEAKDAVDKNAVQGDIYGMETTDTNNYYAAAFITVGGKTYWSTPISCKLNKLQKFTDYTPQGGTK